MSCSINIDINLSTCFCLETKDIDVLWISEKARNLETQTSVIITWLLIWSKFAQELGFQSRRIRTWSVYVTRFTFEHKSNITIVRKLIDQYGIPVSWRCRTSINHIPTNKIKNTLIIFSGVYRRGRIGNGIHRSKINTINQIAILKVAWLKTVTADLTSRQGNIPTCQSRNGSNSRGIEVPPVIKHLIFCRVEYTWCVSKVTDTFSRSQTEHIHRGQVSNGCSAIYVINPRYKS